MKKIFIFAVIATLFCSCKSVKYIPVETTKVEYRDKFLQDSIYLQDSVFVQKKGDTLFLERYKYLYKNRYIRDSIFLNDTVRVPYPVEVVKEVKAPLNFWQMFQIWSGRVALGLIILALVYLFVKLKTKLLA